MTGWRVLAAIASGGALGALVRFGVSLAMIAAGWPILGTLAANVVGSFVIGLLVAWMTRRAVPAEAEAFLIVGVCGGFTSFSAFSLEAVMLAMSGDWAGAGGYVIASLALWMAAVWAGWRLGAALFDPEQDDHTNS